MFWDDRPVRTARELLKACCQVSPEDLIANSESIQTSDLQGTMLRAGDIRRLLVITHGPQSIALADQFDAAYGKIKMRACYCSVFDECWISNMETLHPQTVEQCPKPDVAFAPAKN